MSVWLKEAAGLLLAAMLLAGCASSGTPYTLGPMKTEDPDRRPFATPEETEESQYWDRIDLTVFHQLEKPLDLNWTGRQLGRVLGVAGAKEADNVNALGEPPNSSWYTRRHFYHEMTPAELAKGPNTTGGPDQSGPWTVVSGKRSGASAGFVIEDARGDRYLLKFDGRNYPEASSSAEVISTKIFHAAGYFVPENYIAYFDPDRLVIEEGAEVRVGDGSTRSMTMDDVAAILEGRVRNAQGQVRALASKYVAGQPYGPWNFRGTRDGDPNDRVKHEHRRELRGLRVISAWLNDADRRAANTLAVYTDGKFFEHYLIDFGSTLGANGGGTHRPIHGQAYMIDPRYIMASTLGLGLYERPWTQYDPTPRYPSVGYYRADVFKPGRWVMTYPNPAFEKMTLRDAFWGAKIVTSFSDEDLEAIVETAQMSNPEAEAYLLDVLKQRRDATGRYWFSRINPLDHFRVEGSFEGPSGSPRTGTRPGARLESPTLHFEDLMVEAGLAPAKEAAYAYELHHGETRLAHGVSEAPAVPLQPQHDASFSELMAGKRGDERVVRVTLRTRRLGRKPSKATHVWVYFPPGEARPRVAGVQREV